VIPKIFNNEAWWSLECSMFGFLWKEKVKHLFHFLPFLHPIKFYLSIFSIGFKVLFYHLSRPLLHIFPSFFSTYKLQSHNSKYKIFHTFITKLILIEFFFLFLNSWCHTWLCFMGFQLHKWMKNRLENSP